MITNKKRFPDISTSAFQHSLDVQAIDTLKKLKGFDFICHKIIEYGYEKVRYIDLIANHVKVTPRQCPKIYEIFKDAVETLDVSEPALFIGQSPELNAYTSGSENPFIVLNSTLVEIFTENELHAVIGHELGHIKCKHGIYSMVADFLRDFVDMVSGATFGIGGLLSSGLELALFKWYRKAELSCDRAALLATQDLDACLKMHMKLAGGSPVIADQMDTDEFLRQAELYTEMDADTLGKIYKFLLMRYQTHPYSVLRAKELKIWAESDEYKKILQGDYQKMEQEQKKLEGSPSSESPSSTATLGATKDATVGFVKTGIKGLFGKSK